VMNAQAQNMQAQSVSRARSELHQQTALPVANSALQGQSFGNMAPTSPTSKHTQVLTQKGVLSQVAPSPSHALHQHQVSHNQPQQSSSSFAQTSSSVHINVPDWRLNISVEDRLNVRSLISSSYSRSCSSFEDLLEIVVALQEEAIFATSHTKQQYLSSGDEWDNRVRMKINQLAGNTTLQSPFLAVIKSTSNSSVSSSSSSHSNKLSPPLVGRRRSFGELEEHVEEVSSKKVKTSHEPDAQAEPESVQLAEKVQPVSEVISQGALAQDQAPPAQVAPAGEKPSGDNSDALDESE